jgi:uncharacterized protein (TIGR03437 family)
MKWTMRVAALALAVAADAVAAPQIAAILNAASYTLPGLPNYGIAPGSIFIVFGTELGPAVLQQSAGYPLQPVLGGTSMRVTVGATVVDAVMVYTSATQAAAILPSATPAGIGYLAVTYQGKTSQSGAFRILRNAPGLLAQNQAGTGPALAQNFNTASDQPRNGLTRAAHPGQVVTFWATGLGPIAGSDSAVPVPQDLDLNLQILVGGQPAIVRYKGRSGCCAGVDQIVIEIPRGVEGCYVPVAARVGDFVSNFTSLAIVSSGDVCTDLNGLSGADLEKLQAGGTISSGIMWLSVAPDCGGYYYSCPPGSAKLLRESGGAYFSRSGWASVSGQTRPGLPSAGSCSMLLTAPQPPGPFIPPVTLDAGPVMNLSGPKGTRQLALNPSGSFSQIFSTGATQVQFIEPGDYVFDNGTGGADVGPFRASLTVPKPFTPVVQRSAAGVKVIWTGGTPSGVVIIEGSGAPGLSGAIARFVCTERVSAGQFAIPAEVLLSLPPDAADHSGLTVSATSTIFTIFRTRGLDFGQFSFSSTLQ